MKAAMPASNGWADTGSASGTARLPRSGTSFGCLRARLRSPSAVPRIHCSAVTAPSPADAEGPVTYDAAQRTCRFTDPRIGESSGLASASFSDTALWTHNDSGDTGRFFLVDTPSCRTVASYRISAPPTVQEPD